MVHQISLSAELLIGQYVYIGLPNKQKKNHANCGHYAGQIVNIDLPDIEISFLKHSSSSLWWPDPSSISWVDASDVHLPLCRY